MSAKKELQGLEAKALQVLRSCASCALVKDLFTWALQRSRV